MGELFGTDGVRGVANQELTPELAFRLGRAGAFVLSRSAAHPTIVIGKDTRISGDMLEAALIAGICSVGADAWRVGIMPTPAIAYLTRDLGATAGVVISASHNPFADNGIKFFAGNGYKLPDAMEDEIEALVQDIPANELPHPTGTGIGSVREISDAGERYQSFALRTVEGMRLTGLKIVVDCANGAASRVTPRVLDRLGASVISLSNQPDGTNINNNCGSTHLRALQQAVTACGADLGIAHDGDADRVLAVDAAGNVVDGDGILVICGSYLKQQGKLANNTMVVTVMSNLGLYAALKKAGIHVHQTRVGDRYVLAEMVRAGAVLGGEQSGHIIFLNHNTTGDGLVTALQLLKVMAATGSPLADLAGQMTRYPQVMVNVQVQDKEKVTASNEMAEAIARAEAMLGLNGRVLVRPSGTEPVIRIMAEGSSKDQLEEVVCQLAKVVKNFIA